MLSRIPNEESLEDPSSLKPCKSTQAEVLGFLLQGTPSAAQDALSLSSHTVCICLVCGSESCPGSHLSIAGKS